MCNCLPLSALTQLVHRLFLATPDFLTTQPELLADLLQCPRLRTIKTEAENDESPFIRAESAEQRLQMVEFAISIFIDVFRPEDLGAQVHAHVADVDAGTSDELLDLGL
jgi:hypothetical protein